MEQDFKLSYPRIELLNDNELIRKLKHQTLKEGDLLYRVIHKRNGWDFYDCGLFGRFNGCLPNNAPVEFKHDELLAFGTCYLSADIRGALGESIFRNAHLNKLFFVSKAQQLTRKVIEVEIPMGVELKFIDLTVLSNRQKLGLDTQIFSTADYDICFAWAQIFNIMGFDGVKYSGRNSESECYALFEKSRLDIDTGEDIGLISSDRVLPDLLALANLLDVPVE